MSCHICILYRPYPFPFQNCPISVSYLDKSQNNLFLLVSVNFELFFIKYINRSIFMAFYTKHRVVNIKTMLASNSFMVYGSFNFTKDKIF